MAQLRDDIDWHRAYDDPGSSLSWRLDTVARPSAPTGRHDRVAGASPVPAPATAATSLGVLAEPGSATDVRLALLEIHPELTQRARAAAARLPERHHVEAREVDAGP